MEAKLHISHHVSRLSLHCFSFLKPTITYLHSISRQKTYHLILRKSTSKQKYYIRKQKESNLLGKDKIKRRTRSQ
uniref:Uncharacterized protein n=1 Tax=Rhizophora mucronata TaxID=61149 RepID=A0A2P2KK93_RHIMU